MGKGKRIVLIVILSLGVIFFLVKLIFDRQIKIPEVDADTLPGIETGTAPWPPETIHLAERMQDAYLPAQKEESEVFHIHQHLDIFIHGQATPVPMLGIDRIHGFFSPLHVHDTSSVIHVESSVVEPYTLGQFFDAWGVRFNSRCIGGYCNDGANTLRVYVNGNQLNSDPVTLVLERHQEIVVAYGTNEELPNPIPSSFTFAEGL